MREHLKSYLDNSRTASVRGLRILLEYFYATEIFEPILKEKLKIISVFGSARSQENTADYQEAYKLGKLLYQSGYAVVTGASMGIMQAANHGVSDAIAEDLIRQGKAKDRESVVKTRLYQSLLKKHSVGLKITLPFEPRNNPFVGVHATFHYFMVRKFFFGTLSRGFIACEGGWGTRDELFEVLTLVQTGKAPLLPIIYVSKDPEHLTHDLAHTLKKGYIHKEDMRLLQIVGSAKEAADIVSNFYRHVERLDYTKDGTIRIELVKSAPLIPGSARLKRLEKEAKALEPFIGSAKFHKTYIELSNYPYVSFGYLRAFVDCINR